jgi:hypothetical protein
MAEQQGTKRPVERNLVGDSSLGNG